VLTDQAMPRMTGFQLIEEIGKDWPHPPVILATGFAELPPGIDPQQVTLAKPFTQYVARPAGAGGNAQKSRSLLRLKKSGTG